MPPHVRRLIPILFIACTAPEGAAPALVAGPLVDAAGWVAVDPMADLFPSHRPAAFRCLPQAWGAEGRTFEVDTGACEYLAVSQPSLLPVAAGDTLTATVAHFPLVALEPATAHVALAFDGAIVWEREIPIPSDTRIYEFSWTAQRTAPAGTPVQFHLHNHGSNNWFIGEISRAEGEEG